MAEMEKTSAARPWRRPRRRSMAWRMAVRGKQGTARSARTAVRPTVGRGDRRGTARTGGGGEAAQQLADLEAQRRRNAERPTRRFAPWSV
uniref:Uncharacterized protein n=1 Tax=Oryza nivara TaxID=4536 RepID=A0A0E0FU98_ORYNI